MAEIKKWTNDDIFRQQRLISDTKDELLKFASDFDLSCIEDSNMDCSYNDKENVNKKYKAIRILRQIEGLQQILVYHGVSQPFSSLPFLAHHAAEKVKKDGIVGRN